MSETMTPEAARAEIRRRIRRYFLTVLGMIAGVMVLCIVVGAITKTLLADPRQAAMITTLVGGLG